MRVVVDRLVYVLYGLTDVGIALIEAWCEWSRQKTGRIVVYLVCRNRFPIHV